MTPRPLRTVVLAGGQGRRLASVTGGVPKQFWAPNGEPTLLQQTVDRFRPVTPEEDVVTVVDASHRTLVAGLAPEGGTGRVIYQPEDRGTAAGVLFAVSEIAGRDPEAIVLLTPADHGVARPDVFLDGLRRAVTEVARHAGALVLGGARPTAATGDYGWILPARQRAGSTRTLAQVVRFVEKPPAARARAFFASGGVWNTMVLAARVRRLLDVFADRAPDLAALFTQARRLDVRERARFLESRYRDLRRLDFSQDIIAPTPGLAVLTWPTSLGWTDLGMPDRLRAWQAGRPRLLSAEVA